VDDGDSFYLKNPPFHLLAVAGVDLRLAGQPVLRGFMLARFSKKNVRRGLSLKPIEFFGNKKLEARPWFEVVCWISRHFYTTILGMACLL